MATAYKPEITDAGQELLARVIAGSRMEFTRAQLGSGSIGSGEIGPLVALLAPEADAQIASNRKPDAGEVLLNVQYTNKNLATGFDMDELGIWAREVLSDSYGPEVLYCYMTLGGATERIEAASQGMFTRSWDIPVAVGSALNVTAVVDTGALVTQEQMVEVESRIDSVAGTANRAIPRTGATDLSGVFSPSADNTGQLGGSTRRWGQVFARSFVGDLTGTASTATKWNILTYIPTPSAALDYFLMIEAGTGRALPVPKANFIPVSGATNLAGTFAPATANTARVGTPEKPFYQMNAQTFVGSLTGTASGNVPLTGSTNLSGVFSPSADNTGQIGGSTRRWGQVFANAYSGGAFTGPINANQGIRIRWMHPNLETSSDAPGVWFTDVNGGTGAGSAGIFLHRDALYQNNLRFVATKAFFGNGGTSANIDVYGGDFIKGSSERFKADITAIDEISIANLLRIEPIQYHPSEIAKNRENNPWAEYSRVSAIAETLGTPASSSAVRDAVADEVANEAWAAYDRVQNIARAIGAEPSSEAVRDAERQRYGVSAERTALIDPTYVAFDDEGNPVGVSYLSMIAPMLKLLQDQDAKLKQQSAKIDDLETRLAALEERMTT